MLVLLDLPVYINYYKVGDKSATYIIGTLTLLCASLNNDWGNAGILCWELLTKIDQATTGKILRLFAWLNLIHILFENTSRIWSDNTRKLCMLGKISMFPSYFQNAGKNQHGSITLSSWYQQNHGKHVSSIFDEIDTGSSIIQAFLQAEFILSIAYNTSSTIPAKLRTAWPQLPVSYGMVRV